MKLLVPKSLEITPTAIDINGILHSVIQAVGYPRKVEDGWLTEEEAVRLARLMLRDNPAALYGLKLEE